MEIEMKTYIVYVKTDDANRITSVNSNAFLHDTDGWVEIDSGFGYDFMHAQGNYFPKPIMDDRGIYRYKLEYGKPVERTQEEMDADYVPSVPQPSDAERIAQLEEQNAMLTECILEMSGMLYA